MRVLACTWFSFSLLACGGMAQQGGPGASTGAGASPSAGAGASAATSTGAGGGPDASAPPPVLVQLPAPAVTYAVSDIHGGYDRLVSLLAQNQVIEAVPASPAEVRWAAGGAALVVLGDLIDKGPQGVEVIDVLRALEADAASHGGAVVVMIGNHEAEFFVDPNNSKASTNDGIDIELAADNIDPAVLASGGDARGAWLRARPLGAVVGAWFFSHAGNTKGRTFVALESALGAALAQGGYADPEITGSDSILEAKDWYTGSTALGASYAAALGVQHIVFGHDPHALGPDGHIAASPDGALIRIDCGMSPDVDYSMGALLRIRHQASGDIAEELRAGGTVNPVWP